MHTDLAPDAISRRRFLAGAVSAATTSASSQLMAEPQKPVNILYLHSHDSGRYLRPYGHNVPTPNLAALAKRGILFRHMYCAAPSCSASRSALLTGQSPHQAGMNGLAHRGWKLNDYNQHILHTLSANGYHTVLAGLQHLTVKIETLGFDEVLPGTHRLAKDVADHTVEFLSRRPKTPFFLDCGFFETHRPYPAATDNADYILPPAPMPDIPATRLDMAAFHQSARDMDTAVGRILDALEMAGLAENTLVLSTTDHGIAFPEMKANLRDSGIGVSCILRGPGVFSQPGVCDSLLSHIDVFPTICEYLGIAPPAWLTGKSFLSILRGEKADVNEAIYAEVTYHAAYEPMRAVRTRRYKYIRRFDGRTTAVLPNCDDGPSKSAWLQQGWKQQHLVAKEELFDLFFDPNEHNNLVADSGHSDVLKDMRSRLDQWMHATSDPLLKGDVPLPSGGITTPVDAISP